MKSANMLFTSNETQYDKMNANELLHHFQDACARGDIETIDYILTSSKVKEHINIHANSDRAFSDACEYGNLEVVRYLLESDHLKDHINIANNKSALINAARGNHLDIFHYLEQKIQPNKELMDYAFISAATTEAKDILKYLIYDYGLEKTDEIIESIQELDKIAPRIEEMFKIRENKDNINVKKSNKLKEEIEYS